MIHFDFKLFIFQQNHQAIKQKHLLTR